MEYAANFVAAYCPARRPTCPYPRTTLPENVSVIVRVISGLHGFSLKRSRQANVGDGNQMVVVFSLPVCYVENLGHEALCIFNTGRDR